MAATANGIQSQIETEPLEWSSGKNRTGVLEKLSSIAGLAPGVGLEG